ncbi:hypothetical protein [Streptomyces sp. NPDC047939]|uniref:hypothetical protein n=1 Tax=Streptomyces sp. NPDC047939 TaxID=3155381 RepID=UPI003429782D
MTTLTESQFTTPDIRPSGLDALTTTQDLDMDEIRAEIAAALQHIEDLRQRYPYDAGGHRPEPPYEPIPPDTHSHGSDGNTNANPNTNLGDHAPIFPPGT